MTGAWFSWFVGQIDGRVLVSHLVVADGSKTHSAKAFDDTRLIFSMLPTYSSELNQVERVFKEVRQGLKARIFSSLEEAEQRLQAILESLFTGGQTVNELTCFPYTLNTSLGILISIIIKNTMLTTIIYDSSEKIGHQAEYIEHLMLYIITQEESNEGKYVFVLHPNIVSRLDETVLDKVKKLANLIELPKILLDRLKTSDSFINRYHNSKIEEKYLAKLISSYNKVKVIFMAFDNQILLASRRSLYHAHCQAIGIFFRPLAAPVRPSRSLKDRFLGMLKKFLKLFLVYRLSKNSYIKKIFVSEDTEVMHWLNNHIKSGLFYYLSDPVKKLKIENRIDWRNHYSISTNEPVFLVFGSMDTRKNLINIIHAFSLFKDEKNHKKGTLLILGSFVTPDYKVIVEKSINTYCTHCLTSIIIDDRFVGNDEMEQVFSESQTVVMPYLDFHGSSGVLSRAAEYKKAVITSDEGLVSQLVNKYKLGHTVDPKNVQQIAFFMELSLSYLADETLGANFLVNKDPYLFSTTLLNDENL